MLLLVAAAVAAAAVGVAQAALFFLFQPTTAKPGDLVTVRLGGTPSSFTYADRQPPLRRPIRVYLVRDELADEIRGRLDLRLHFVGTIVPDRDHRGVLTFAVPPLDTGTYAAAAWCPECARHSAGRSFFVLGIPRVSRYRKEMGLRIAMPSPTESCPVTLPRHPEGWYGNGLLFTQLDEQGRLRALRRDGRLFQKLGWLPKKGFTGVLRVRGERLDAASPPLRVLNVFWGHACLGPWARGSWATPVEFPSEGCWRIRATVGDVSLTYVAQVVAS